MYTFLLLLLVYRVIVCVMCCLFLGKRGSDHEMSRATGFWKESFGSFVVHRMMFDDALRCDKVLLDLRTQKLSKFIGGQFV
jgi:hypothetical protein